MTHLQNPDGLTSEKFSSHHLVVGTYLRLKFASYLTVSKRLKHYYYYPYSTWSTTTIHTVVVKVVWSMKIFQMSIVVIFIIIIVSITPPNLWFNGPVVGVGVYSLQLNYLPRNHSIIAFGDSLTHGLYLGDYNKLKDKGRRTTTTGGVMGYHSYAINLRKHINNRSISVLEYGRNMDETHTMIPRLNKILHQFIPTNQSLPLFVIILAGELLFVIFWSHLSGCLIYVTHIITIIIIITITTITIITITVGSKLMWIYSPLLLSRCIIAWNNRRLFQTTDSDPTFVAIVIVVIDDDDTYIDADG